MGFGDLAPGTVFASDYRIVEPLAEGGMGAVYVVEQMSTSKRRALKLMHAQLIANPELRKRFEQEAKIGARIESDHIVEVQAAGIDVRTNMPYLVMELLDGDDLAATMKRRGALSPMETGAIFLELCHAVGAAHAAGIVHRDLKPENIFLVRSKRAGVAFTVKVLDFGIAKLLAEGATRSTEAIGSPIWLAPEQTERSPVSPATDVWALGLIAFHLLTGCYYWRSVGEDTTVAQLLREILFSPLPVASARAREVGRSLPPGFDAWFARCVARSPSERFPDARAAYEALVPILSPGAQSGTQPSQYGPPPQQYGPPPERRVPPLPWESAPPAPRVDRPPLPWEAPQQQRPLPTVARPLAPPVPVPPRIIAATPPGTASTSPTDFRRSKWRRPLAVLGAVGGIGLAGTIIASAADGPPTYEGDPLTYEEASKRFASAMTPAPKLEPSAVVEKLRASPALEACASDAKLNWVSFRIVLVQGRVAGLTVDTIPASSTVASCAKKAVGDLSWKSGDVARYDVWLAKRDGHVEWPGF